MSKRKQRSSLTSGLYRASVFPRGGELVRLVGKPIRFEVEQHHDEKRIDHVWLHLKTSVAGVFRVSLNTWSLMSFQSGYDPRIRVAIVPSHWNELPALGIFPANGLDYADIPMTDSGGFREYDRFVLEQLIGSRFGNAVVVEVWGEVYLRGTHGIHQVHSRRASAVIATDHIGRDGAVRLYYEEKMAAELLLFKFFGQP